MGFSFDEIFAMTISQFNFQMYYANKVSKMQQNMIAYAVALGSGHIKS